MIKILVTTDIFAAMTEDTTTAQFINKCKRITLSWHVYCWECYTVSFQMYGEVYGHTTLNMAIMQNSCGSYKLQKMGGWDKQHKRELRKGFTSLSVQ